MNQKNIHFMVLALTTGAGLLIQQCAWYPVGAQPKTLTPTDQSQQPNSSSTSEVITSTPAEPYEGCYYVWASHELDEASAWLQQGLRELQPEALARASAFGEDCIYADGRSEFGAMETDFYVTLSVDDLSNEGEMGEWISRVMSLLKKIPAGQIQGSQPGFVEFTFKKTGVESLILRVPITEYTNEAEGLSGALLFRHFHNP